MPGIKCDCKGMSGEEREDCTYPNCQTFDNSVTVVHLTPKINDDCEHVWPITDVKDDDRCAKCGVTFMRYVFSLDF